MLNELFKIVSDETRLRILLLLSKQELCVCELVHIMQESQPKISKHIAKIRAHKFVTTKRNEQYIYYSINQENTLLMDVLAAIEPYIVEQQTIQQDRTRLSNMDGFVCGSN
jgi:ArsR family transcriptional regulator